MKSNHLKASTAPRSRKGFTLIELLIVIAIIAILATILFPVFARARENGKRSSCMSSMRQIGMGLAQYTQDADERTPPINSTSNCPCWSDWILPYVSSEAIFSACPSRTKTTSTVPFGQWTKGSKDNIAFAYNNLYTGGGSTDGQETTPPSGATNGIPGLALAVMPIPTETIIFGDSAGQYMVYSSNKNDIVRELAQPVTGSTAYLHIGRSGTSNTNRDQQFVGRHFDGANFVFVDGHAKWLPMTEAARTNSNGVMYNFTVEDDKNW